MDFQKPFSKFQIKIPNQFSNFIFRFPLCDPLSDQENLLNNINYPKSQDKYAEKQKNINSNLLTF
jgi:hypothetical protein